jgi:proteasome lid subunit RPN8/RPN11
VIVAGPGQTSNLAITAPPATVIELVLGEGALQHITRAVRAAEQSEICGFLFGQVAANRAYIQEARAAENIYHSRTSFAISPREHATAVAGATNGNGLLGIYHHHFGPARPSRPDRASMRLQSLIWLIIGRPENPTFNLEWRAFQQGVAGIQRLKILFM